MELTWSKDQPWHHPKLGDMEPIMHLWCKTCSTTLDYEYRIPDSRAHLESIVQRMALVLKRRFFTENEAVNKGTRRLLDDTTRAALNELVKQLVRRKIVDYFSLTAEEQKAFVPPAKEQKEVTADVPTVAVDVDSLLEEIMEVTEPTQSKAL